MPPSHGRATPPSQGRETPPSQGRATPPSQGRETPQPAGAQQPPAGSVDARFTLAAERTVLAWIRTALGFVAAGVAIVYVAPDLPESWWEATLGVVMVVLGCGIAVIGGLRWQQTSRALREGGPLPGPAHVLAVIAAIVVVSVLIVAVILMSRP